MRATTSADSCGHPPRSNGLTCEGQLAAIRSTAAASRIRLDLLPARPTDSPGLACCSRSEWGSTRSTAASELPAAVARALWNPARRSRSGTSRGNKPAWLSRPIRAAYPFDRVRCGPAFPSPLEHGTRAIDAYRTQGPQDGFDLSCRRQDGRPADGSDPGSQVREPRNVERAPPTRSQAEVPQSTPSRTKPDESGIRRGSFDPDTVPRDRNSRRFDCTSARNPLAEPSASRVVAACVAPTKPWPGGRVVP